MDSLNKKELVESELKISITRQSELLGIARSALYYVSKINQKKIAIKNHIQTIYNEIPIYGALKVHKQLLEDGFSVSINSVQKYRQKLGLKAVLAVKPPLLIGIVKLYCPIKYQIQWIQI